MTCKNLGPYHLGISPEACHNANGIWSRGPCTRLQDCIEDRPKPADSTYSLSFENFVQSNLEITDATDQAQCEKSRKGVGYTGDSIDDVQACSLFHDLLCNNPSIAAVNKAANGTEQKPPSGNLVYTPIR